LGGWRRNVDYDPFSDQILDDPNPVYAQLREEAPAYYLEKYDAWALSRFEDIWRASNEPQNYSAAQGTTPANLLTRQQPVTSMLNFMDPPEHTRLRSVIRRCFMPNFVTALVPTAEKIVAEALDQAFEKGEIDVIRDFGSKLSAQIACLAIGLPCEDAEMLVDMVQRFFWREPGVDGMSDVGLAATEEMAAYFRDCVRERRRRPTEALDTVNALVHYRYKGRSFSDEELASHLTMLIIGGTETFPKVLATGVIRLWQHPGQRDEVVRDPSLIPDAFNEILRYDMPTQFLGRTLLRDVEIHGQTLCRGQVVLFLYPSGNRDPREFADPDVFWIRRCPPRILSFGAGSHACLGTHVARMEGQVALSALLARIPDYEVDLDRAERLRTEFVQGYASLPLRFQPM